jgi:hypothetical protein
MSDWCAFVRSALDFARHLESVNGNPFGPLPRTFHSTEFDNSRCEIHSWFLTHFELLEYEQPAEIERQLTRDPQALQEAVGSA